MVSVFFYCSSPYVGYTLKQADYVNKQMIVLKSRDQMTETGFRCFNSSGSFMLLGRFEGKRYFHTRQSKSENYDEQGRRIYANIAFLGDEPADEKTINNIAAYSFFEEDAFYKEITQMITLLSEGFTVDFEKLSDFLKFMSECDLVIETESRDALSFYSDITDNSGKTIDFIVLEATWDYFVRQVENSFNGSISNILSEKDAVRLSGSAGIKLSGLEKGGKEAEETKEVGTDKTEIKEVDLKSAETVAEEDRGKHDQSSQTVAKVDHGKGDKASEDLEKKYNSAAARLGEVEGELKQALQSLHQYEEDYNDLKERYSVDMSAKDKRIKLMGLLLAGVSVLLIAAIIIIFLK